MQVGTPAEIHDRPRSRFVADFMGYRNFFPVTVDRVQDGDGVLARGKDLTLTGRSVGAPAPGASAVAAVRPEDVEVTTAPAGPNVVHGTVRLVEYLGREHDIEVVLESGQTVMARVARPVDVGSAVGLRLPPERVVVLPAEDSA
jgi:putative spermidine/putrescine transport system ATP-binding protein